MPATTRQHAQLSAQDQPAASLSRSCHVKSCSLQSAIPPPVATVYSPPHSMFHGQQHAVRRFSEFLRLQALLPLLVSPYIASKITRSQPALRSLDPLGASAFRPCPLASACLPCLREEATSTAAACADKHLPNTLRSNNTMWPVVGGSTACLAHLLCKPSTMRPLSLSTKQR